MTDYRYNPVDTDRNTFLLAGDSSVFARIGIGVPDADQALEVSGIVHISAEQGTTPDAPANGDGGLLYTKADGKPYWRSNDVSETDLSAAGGGSGDITRVNITAGTGLTGTQNTASGDHTQTLALSHLGIQSLSDPGADRIMFWDDTAGVVAFLVPNDNLAIDGTNLNATDTNTTYSEATTSADGLMSTAHHDKLDGIEAGATADQSNAEIKTAVEAGADIALGGNPTTTTQSAGNNSTRIATTAYADAAASGGGGGISWDGSTAQGVATFKDSDEATVEANLTFDGNSLLCVTGSASAVPCTIKGHASQTADIVNFQKGTSVVAVIDNIGQFAIFEAGSANPSSPLHIEWQNGGELALFKRTVDDPVGHAYIKVDNTANAASDAQLRLTSANDGASKVFFGDAADVDVGRIVYDHGDNSMDFYTNATKNFVIRHDAIVDFKIAGGSKTVTLQNDAVDASMMSGATVTVNATEWLTIKVNGNTRYIPVWS